MRFLLQLIPDYDTAAYDELDTLLHSYALEPSQCYTRPHGHQPRLPYEESLRSLSQALQSPLPLASVLDIHCPKVVSRDPFVLLDLPSFELAQSLFSRSVMARGMWELYGEAVGSLHALVRDVAATLKSRVASGTLGVTPGSSWRFDCCAYGKTVSNRASGAIRQHFFRGCRVGGTGEAAGPIDPLTTGPVNLSAAATITLNVILDCGEVADDGSTGGRRCLHGTPDAVVGETLCVGHWEDCTTSDVCFIPNASDAQALKGGEGSGGTALTSHHPTSTLGRGAPLRRVFFGRHVSVPTLREQWLHKLSLSTRPYLGPTTLDPQLALVMASLGGASKGKVCYDPCVGTGSLTLAASALGALTFGSDCDLRVLGGKLGRNMATNFTHYGLGSCDAIAGDFLTWPFVQGGRGAPVKEVEEGWVDIILSDPPYGIRAGAKGESGGGVGGGGGGGANGGDDDGEGGGDTEEAEEEEEEYGSTMDGLLDTAARMLVKGGKLVYLHPATRAMTVASLPTHPLLALVSLSEETLNPVLTRLLVVMERVGGPYLSSQAGGYVRCQRVAALAASKGLRDIIQLPRPSPAEKGEEANHDQRFILGEEGGLKAIKQALYEAWYEKHKGSKEDIEEALLKYREARKGGGEGGGGEGTSSTSTSTTTLPRKRILKLQKRRLERQEFRLERLEKEVKAAEAAALERAARKASGGGGEVEGEGVIAAATFGVSPKGGLSKTQKKAARRAAAEAALAAGEVVKIAGVAFDKL